MQVTVQQAHLWSHKALIYSTERPYADLLDLERRRLIEHLVGRLEKARWTTEQQPRGDARAQGSDALDAACRQCSEGSTVAFRCERLRQISGYECGLFLTTPESIWTFI